MNIEEFTAAYNPDTKCVATYRKENGDKLKGLVLQEAWRSVGPGTNWCINIDSFFNPVRLADVIAIKDTGVPWSEGTGCKPG